MKKLFLLIIATIILLPTHFVLAATELNDPLALRDSSIPALIGVIINNLLGIIGALALAMFIYGGFTWMMAAGEAAKVKKGMDTLVWATIGLITIFTSYALVHFVITSLTTTAPSG